MFGLLCTYSSEPGATSIAWKKRSRDSVRKCWLRPLFQHRKVSLFLFHYSSSSLVYGKWVNYFLLAKLFYLQFLKGIWTARSGTSRRSVGKNQNQKHFLSGLEKMMFCSFFFAGALGNMVRHSPSLYQRLIKTQAPHGYETLVKITGYLIYYTLVIT